MARPRRPSAQTAAVVLALAQKPAAWHYGYQLCQDLGLKAGSVYPILMRLADRGLLETAWERDAPAGRPPRHLYRLTGPGRALAGELAANAEAPGRPARRAGAVGGPGRAGGRTGRVGPAAPGGRVARRPRPSGA
jgi:PadR family transcriptional regulator, regulatory protein PadR